MEFEYHNCENMEEGNEIFKWVGLNIWHFLVRYETATIKYCPFCGEKLG